MNRATVLSLIALIALPAVAQPPATQPVTGKFAAPQQLFNGKDLTGWVWHSEPESKIEQTWSVKGGVLHCAGETEGMLHTEKELGPDYVLTFEFRHVTEGGGAFLFGINGPEKLPPKAMQVLATYGNVGELLNRGDFNWFVEMERYRERDRMVRIGPNSEKPLGQWNVMEIYVDHSDLRIFLNGVLQNSASGMDDVTGKIGFLTGGAEMEFRTIQITPIVKK